jgi:hypothetical protein
MGDGASKMLLGLVVVFGSTMGFGQAAGSKAPDLNLKALDCRTQWSDLDSCKSFTELLQNKDKDLLEAFKPDQNAFVCFRSEEDAFFVIGWQIASDFRKAPNKPGESSAELVAASMASYTLYRNGVLSDWHAWFDYWKKWPFQSDADAHISAKNQKQGNFNADASEVNVSFGFENRIGTTTKYSVSVRRSTGRFTETISAPDTKGGKEVPFDRTGRCLQYPPPPAAQ